MYQRDHIHHPDCPLPSVDDRVGWTIFFTGAIAALAAPFIVLGLCLCGVI